MNVMRRLIPKILFAVAALSLAGCDATKLREHNLQLESLLKARTEANDALRKAIRNDDRSALEQETRLDQIKADLAALAFDASKDAEKVKDNATKVGYLFTAARAGSKAGRVLATVFADKIAESKKKEDLKKGDVGTAAADADAAKANLVNPLLYGIVIPAQDICKDFKKNWEKPARDCAYMEAVGYFAAVDDLVKTGQVLEDKRKKRPDGKPLTSEKADAGKLFKGLVAQFQNIKKLGKSYTEMDISFRRFLDIQIFRAFCSAQRLQVSFGGDAGQITMMKDHLIGLGGTTLKSFMHAGGGGPNCRKAR